MKQVDGTYSSGCEVKKSTFLSFLTPIDNFENLKKELQSTHLKANHIVWAYRTLNEFEQIVENSSDDKEPKGTSGPPCLNVLKGDDIILSSVLVVRYFGGIKLGTGGLVRAYSRSVQEVIKESNFITYEKLFSVKFSVTYTHLQRFEHFFKTNSFLQGDRDFDQNGAIWTIQMTKKQKELFLEFLKNFNEIKPKISSCS